jgi:hypothetical protein
LKILAAVLLYFVGAKPTTSLLAAATSTASLEVMSVNFLEINVVPLFQS